MVRVHMKTRNIFVKLLKLKNDMETNYLFLTH